MLYHTVHASIRWSTASGLAHRDQQQPGASGSGTTVTAHFTKLEAAYASGLMGDVLAAAAPVQAPWSSSCQQALGACSPAPWQGTVAHTPEQQPSAAAASPTSRGAACWGNLPPSPTKHGQRKSAAIVPTPTGPVTCDGTWQLQPWHPQDPRSQLLWGTSHFTLFPPLPAGTWATLSQRHAAITAAAWEEEQAEQQAARVVHRHPAFVPGFGGRSSTRWVDHRVRVQSG
jgi:hypothetical protein